MYNTIAEIEKTFQSVGLACKSHDEGNLSFLETVLTDKSCTATARLISNGNDQDTKLITNAFVTVPPRKQEAALVLLNEMNRSFKFAKFVMGDDGGVYGEYDIPACLNKSGPGAAALEVTLRFAQIINDVYRKIVCDLKL